MQFSQAEILQEFEALMTGRSLTDMANATALIMSRFHDINWVGFYLVDEKDPETLWLGPFQGLPACTMIPFSKGVCGAGARTQQTQNIADVDCFPGHIVCDSRSKSELVIPLVSNGKTLGVLDIDSASLNRFSAEDAKFFETLVSIFMKKTNW